MKSTQRMARTALLRAAAPALVLVACCRTGPPPPPKQQPVASPGPCGLTDQTRFPDDPKFARNLGLFTPPPEPSADELDGHCRAVWQTAVEEKHCGDVVIPEFCAACTPAEQSKCTEGNGRGRVMQRCREESLAAFQSTYTTCKDFVLCAGKLQPKTAECKAGRP